MTCIIEATRDPNLQTAETSSEADRPHSGFTLTPSGAFTVPSLSRIKSAHYFATQWQELHPGIPLIPSRREALGPQGRRTSPKSAPWIPVDGWWDGQHTGKDLIRLLKGDPSLGVGLRLGRRGPGMPWFVDILVKKLQEARPALMRFFERHELNFAATWSDEEGRHRLFVGDDRLERFGQVVTGTINGVGGNPQYAGLEIRLGSDDPSTSLVVLPPTPLSDGGPREAASRRRRATVRDEFTTLTDRFYADLGRFALATNLGADEPWTTSAAPRPAQPVEPPAPRPKRSRKVVAPGGPANPRSAETVPVADSAGQDVERSPSSSELATLAAVIKDEITAGDRLMFRSLEHYRRAGELLTEIKDRVVHGGWERFVEDHCGFCTETANGYMRVFAHWDEVEEMRGANPQPVAGLTLKEVLKRLARPRKKSVTEAAPSKAELTEEIETEASDRPATGADVLRLPARAVRVDCRPADARGGEAPDMSVAGNPAVDLASPLARRGGSPAEVVTVDDDEVGPSCPVDGAPPTGVVITEETRRRAGDLLFLHKHGPIRVQLAKVGNTQAFDADATLWRLTRGIEGEVLARECLTGRERGNYAPVIVDFLPASPPSEWKQCPACGGAGRIEPEVGRCPGCSGDGYIIPT
jgi:hypothetical protein